jgi:hypothetical protein
MPATSFNFSTMPKEVTDAAAATAVPEPPPAGVKFVKNFNPGEVIHLPGKKTFSFKGKTFAYVTDPDLAQALRKVASRYRIIEDKPIPAPKAEPEETPAS